MVNIRHKGQRGEREVAILLNGMLILVMRELGYSEPDVLAAVSSVQRNQNQTAVGGDDLVNTFEMSIEIKRHETLHVNSWWTQCVDQAKRNNYWPVLLYRQNNKPWHCRTYGYMMCPDGTYLPSVIDIDYLSFQNWYKTWIKKKLLNGYVIKS